MNIKKNISNIDTWCRGLLIIIFSAVFHVLMALILLLVLFQFVTKLISGGHNPYVEQFSLKTVSYLIQIIQYLTFQSDEKPFPFGPFKNTESVLDSIEIENDVANNDDITKTATNVSTKKSKSDA